MEGEFWFRLYVVQCNASGIDATEEGILDDVQRGEHSLGTAPAVSLTCTLIRELESISVTVQGGSVGR